MKQNKKKTKGIVLIEFIVIIAIVTIIVGGITLMYSSTVSDIRQSFCECECK